MRRYVVTPRVDLVDANALQNSVCTGIGSPTAVAGFAHAVDRRLAEADAPWRIVGAGVVIHRFQAHGGRPTISPMPFDNEKAKARSNASAIDRARVSGEVSFVFEVTATEDDDLIDDDVEMEALDLVDSLATYGRFAGGQLMPDPFSDEPERSRRVDARTALRLLLEAGDGVLLFDETEFLASLHAIEPDPLRALTKAIAFYPDATDTNGRRSQRGPLGRGEKFVPVAAGYALLERPKARRTGRDVDALHAYAEPLTTLGRYVPLENLLDEDDPFTGAMWRYTSSPAPHVHPVGIR